MEEKENAEPVQEHSDDGVAPLIKQFLLAQMDLIGNSHNEEYLDAWIANQGLPLLTNAASLRDEASPRQAWELPVTRAQVLQLWLQESVRQGPFRTRSLLEMNVSCRVVPRFPPEEKRSCRYRLQNMMYLPIKTWLPHYDWRHNLRGDVVAGISTAFNQVAKGLAFALLAGLPPANGLYSAMLPGLVYTFLGTSPHLGIAPSPLVALLTGALTKSWCEQGDFYPLGKENYPLPPDKQWVGNCDVGTYALLVQKMALIQGVVLLLLGCAHFGFIIRFFSRPLMSGFLSAATVIICVSQLKYLLFNHQTHIDDSKSAAVMLYNVLSHLPQAHGLTILCSLFFLALLIGFKLWPRTRHLYSLILVTLCTLTSYLLAVAGARETLNLYLTGTITRGFPSPTLAPFAFTADDSARLVTMVELSGVIALVGFLEHSSAAHMFAIKHNYTVDINQEMVAIGFCNIFGCVFRCMPTMGAIGMSAMLNTFGGKTHLANGVCCFVVMLCTLFLTDLFYYLPKATLALIVMSAVIGMIDLQEVKFLYRGHRRDLYIYLTLVVVTLAFGIDQGLVVALLMNASSHVYRSGNTEVAELGRIPGTNTFQSTDKQLPVYLYHGVVIFQFNGPIFFGNEDRFKQELYAYGFPELARTHAAGCPNGVKHTHAAFSAGSDPADPAHANAAATDANVSATASAADEQRQLKTSSHHDRVVIVDASTISFLDATGVHAIEEVAVEFGRREYLLLFASCNVKVREKLSICGFVDRIGADHFFETIDDALNVALYRPREEFHKYPLPPPSLAGQGEFELDDDAAPILASPRTSVAAGYATMRVPAAAVEHRRQHDSDDIDAEECSWVRCAGRCSCCRSQEDLPLIE